jgi:hypothetical protein
VFFRRGLTQILADLTPKMNYAVPEAGMTVLSLRTAGRWVENKKLRGQKVT